MVSPHGQFMKLLIRGGSIAAGYSVIKSYVDILAASLLRQGIEVINRSRHKETTFDGIDTFYQDIDFFQPDILLIQFGIDDAFQCVYRSEFQENLVQMIRLARVRFNPIVLLATSHNFDNPYDMETVNIYYRSLKIVASDMNCELIPAHHYWAGYLEEYGLRNKDLVLSDPRYPNEKGHRIIAEAMMKGLDKIIENSSEVKSGNIAAISNTIFQNIIRRFLTESSHADKRKQADNWVKKILCGLRTNRYP
jgi:lysophospholipase L1-like esterase